MLPFFWLYSLCLFSTGDITVNPEDQISKYVFDYTVYIYVIDDALLGAGWHVRDPRQPGIKK